MSKVKNVTLKEELSNDALTQMKPALPTEFNAETAYEYARQSAILEVFEFLSREQREYLVFNIIPFSFVKADMDVNGKFGETWNVIILIEGFDKERKISFGNNDYRNEFFDKMNEVVERSGKPIPGWGLRKIHTGKSDILGPDGDAYDMVPISVLLSENV